MNWRAGLWILGVTVLTAAQPTSSVNDAVALVRTAMRIKQTDSQLAKSLHKLRLRESLDEHTIEELQSEGAGPKAVAELEHLREVSEDYPQPASSPVFEAPPEPSTAEQARILSRAREIALGYTRSLPDFITTEAVRRYADERGGWQLKDTLIIKLSYFDQREEYKVQNINGRPTTVPYEAVGGTITQGEFGSLLLEVFRRQSAAEFHWDHWTNLRGRAAHVYTFRVRAANSGYTMRAGRGGWEDAIMAGHHGFVYLDRETNEIVRILSIADSIPPGFPVKSSATLLDYDFTDVGGRQFLLPLRAEVRMGTAEARTRNEVEFHSYKKFGAESSITFGGPVDKPGKH